MYHATSGSSQLHWISVRLGKQTDIIFLDMSKAFDKVSHVTLIAKLRKYHISGPLLEWFSSYLQNRRQRVTIHGATSSEKPVSSRVPQGSIFGPALFLLYVNDLPDAVQNSSVACFADDTKIFQCVNSISDAALQQSDLTKLNSWSTSSGLASNQLKCKCLCVTRKTQPIIYEYTIENKEISTTTMEKGLGILVAADLTWTNHILERCVKGNKLQGLVRRSSADISNVRTRRILYLSIVRPVFGYASQIWCPQSIAIVKGRERVQRRASKFMLNLPFLCDGPYRERLIALELMPLSYWHEYMDLVFFFKAINGMVNITHLKMFSQNL